MAESFSHVSLLGSLRSPVRLETLPSGSECGNFDLILRERSSGGQWFSTIVPCQLWGSKSLDAAQQLLPGQACVFQGKLAKRKRGEVWELVVSGFVLEPLTVPVPVPDVAMSRN